MTAMQGYSPIRRIVALASAYVVALQLVMLPLTVAASNPLSSQLCSQLAASTSDRAPAAPAQANVVCACASGCGMQCCASTLVGPASAVTAIDRTPFAILAPRVIVGISGFMSWRGPQNPRAPPQAA